MFYFPHFSTMYKNDVIIEFWTYTIKHNIPKLKVRFMITHLTLFLRISSKSSSACLYALITTVGCICCSRKGAATASNSPATNDKTSNNSSRHWQPDTFDKLQNLRHRSYLGSSSDEKKCDYLM